jgi:outer membrane protein assembly factor BamA
MFINCINHLYNGAGFAKAAAMRHLILISFSLLLLPDAFALAMPQQAQATLNTRRTVETVEITGIDEDEISEDVREAIHQLAGKPFDQNVADELVVRIQAQDPSFTATVQVNEGSQNNRIKVQFVIEKHRAPQGGDANVNSRYTVERIDVEGFDKDRLSQVIRDEMERLVGAKLNQDQANLILQEINRELQPKYWAVKRIARGSDPQHIVVIYDVRKTRLIPLVDVPANGIVYNSKQGFSIDANVGFGKINRFYVGASDDQDQLIERFYGFNGGFESTRVGTDRVGVALRYGRFHERWQPATVLADRNGIYRERNAFDPSVTFAFDPRFRVTAGLGISELQIQYPDIHQANANTVTASAIFHDVWANATEERHLVDASYEFRAGNHELDSDFIYTRHFVQAEYTYSHSKDHLTLSFLGGKISGNAPLFERFSLGNTITLRGWNKFDIAPAGGNRVVHATVQYGFGKPEVGSFNINNNGVHHSGRFGLGLHIFYDVGAVGNSGSPIVARHSAGFGIGSRKFFMELGFPIRSSRVEPIFSAGLRW